MPGEKRCMAYPKQSGERNLFSKAVRHLCRQQQPDGIAFCDVPLAFNPADHAAFVHGGWHGGWCWQKVIPFLEAASHEVYAPTLTGLAERASELSPNVGLDTHIQDIVGLLEEKDLHGVILVGHSYSGMVITGVVDQVP